MPEYVLKIRIDPSGARAGSAEVVSSLDNIIRHAGQVDTSVSRMETGFQGFRRTLAGLGVALALREIVDATTTFQRIQNTLAATSRTAGDAARTYQFIRAEARRLGLDLQSVAVQYSQLAAAAKGTKLEGNETRRIFTAISEAATVMGLSSDKAALALLAVQQMISKGRVSAEELRRQLAEHLPGAFQMAARAMGVTQVQLDGMLRRGQVLAEDLLPKLATEIQNTFGPGVSRAVTSLQANINRFKTDIFELKVAAGEGLLDGLADAFKDFGHTLTATDVKQLAREIGEFLGKALRQAAQLLGEVADHLTDLKAIIIGYQALRLANWFTTATIAGYKFVEVVAAINAGYGKLVLVDMAATFKAWAAGAIAFASSPAGMVAIALVGIAVAAVYASDAEKDLVKHTKDYNEALLRAEPLLRRNTELINESTDAKLRNAIADRKVLEVEQERIANTLLALMPHGGITPEVRKRLPADAGLLQLERDYNKASEALRRNRSEIEGLMEATRLKAGIDAYAEGFLKKHFQTTSDMSDAQKRLADRISEMVGRFRLGAEAAEAMEKASRSGVVAEDEAARVAERRSKVQQALNAIEGVSAQVYAELAAIIGSYIDREQEAERQTNLNRQATERKRQAAEELGAAEAKLQDQMTGSTFASMKHAAAMEILRQLDAAKVTAASDVGRAIDLQVKQHYEMVYVLGLEADMERKNQEQKIARRQAQAALTDAGNRNTAASRELEVRLRAEAEAKARVISLEGFQFEAILRTTAANQASIDVLQNKATAQRRLNDTEDEAKGRRAESVDWIKQQQFAHRYGDEITSILIQYGQLSKATQELAILEQIRQAIAAENVDLASREGLIRSFWIEAEIRGHASLIDSLNKVQAAGELAAYVAEPVREAWVSTGETIKETMADLFVSLFTGAEVNFKQIAASLLSTMTKAFLEMLARWIAVQRAMKAAQMAGGDYGSWSTVGGGSGGGWMSSIGSLFGAGGSGATTGVGAYTSAGATLDGAAMGTATAGSGWMASLGYFAVAIGAVLVLMNWIKTHQGTFAAIDIAAKNGQAVAQNARGAQDRLALLAPQVKQVVDSINGVIDGLGGTLEGMDAITVYRKGRSKNTRYFVKLASGLVFQFGQDAQAAMDFATLQAIRGAKISGLDPIVKKALQDSTATTLDKLQKDLALAFEVANLQTSQVTVDFDAINEKFSKLRAEIIALLKPSEELTQALANINQAWGQAFKDQRDRLLGVERDPHEQLDRDIDAWNAAAERQRKIYEAEILAKEALVIATEAQIAMMRAEFTHRAGLMQQMGQSMDPEVAEAWAEASRILAQARLDLDAARAALANLPPAITPEERETAHRRLRGSGGGNDAEARAKDLKEFNDGLDDLIAGGKLSDLAMQWRDVAKESKRLEDEGKRLGASIGKVREAQAALRKEFSKDTKNDLAKWLQDFGKSDWEVNLRSMLEYFQKIIDLPHSSGVPDWWGKQARTNFLIGEAQNLLGIMHGYLGDDEASAKLEREFKAQQVQLQYEILKAEYIKYNLNMDLIRQIEGLLPGVIDGILNPIADRENDIADARQRSREEAQREAEEARRIRDAAMDALREFRKSLDFDDAISPLTGEQRLAEATARYQATAVGARAGDAKAWEALPEAARQYLEELLSFTGGGGLYLREFNGVKALLDEILARFSTTAPRPFAVGGVVHQRETVEVAEGGPEAIVPLSSGAIPVRLQTPAPSANDDRLARVLTGGFGQAHLDNRALQARLAEIERALATQSNALRQVMGSLPQAGKRRK